MPLQMLETLSDVTSCRKSCYSSISSSCFYTKANHDKETQLITDGVCKREADNYHNKARSVSLILSSSIVKSLVLYAL